VCSGITPLSAKVKKMGLDFDYFAELEAYEARAEYEAWLDEQEELHILSLPDDTYSPEVVE